MQKNKRASDHTSSLRKVQSTIKKKKKCGSGRKRGITTRKGFRGESFMSKEEVDAVVDMIFGSSSPDRDVSSSKFEEQQFGSVCEPGQDNWCQLSERVASHLSIKVVSLALFDGDEMLFACTGIVLPRGTSRLDLTRFLTSSQLVAVFNDKRNKDDKLRVLVRLPNKETIPGILGLYDKYIAIVTSQGFQEVMPLDMYQETYLPDAPMMVAAGRAYKSSSLMGTTGELIGIGVDYEDLSASTCQITEAGLGGPLIDLAGNFVGMNICFHSDTQKPLFLPSILLRQRLEKYEILIRGKLHGEIMQPYCAELLMGKTSNSRQESYEPPAGASRIIPSGFMDTWDWLESLDYPKPPPLMLELNGRLVRTFEDVFGWSHAWKGYKKFYISQGHGKNAWQRLDKKIVATISRRVVSLVSFNGKGTSFFSCTGFLIRGPSRKGRTRNVIVTSASLVRTCDVRDKIDENMRIEVFLPPNQRLNGTLESYHSGYNIAIVTVKGLRNVCPEDIQFADLMCNICPENMEFGEYSLPERMVAIGRDPEGVLCASMGKPICCGEDLHMSSSFGCEHLKLSNCKITKVGIGGPLIDFFNGCLVGMNFYDGRPDRTPYLPCEQIREVLRTAWSLSDRSVLRLDKPDANEQCRWPVPKPYWYHGLLEMNRFGPMPMRGRVLQ